jgi:hypothetical protein
MDTYLINVNNGWHTTQRSINAGLPSLLGYRAKSIYKLRTDKTWECVKASKGTDVELECKQAMLNVLKSKTIDISEWTYKGHTV